ncbi:MAG: chromate transporter [Faecalibacterium sp.]
MMLYLKLYWEFFCTGLFAVGGGMATLPFLKAIGVSTGWYTSADLMNMLAVSESTPGPIGINMATYVGYTVAGIPGAVIATVGEVTPSILIILAVAAMLNRFRDSKLVQNAFYGLRPASAGLVGAACVTVALEVFTHLSFEASASGLWNTLCSDGSGMLRWPSLVLAAILLWLTNKEKHTKGLHPIVFIGVSAVAGIALGAVGLI